VFQSSKFQASDEIFHDEFEMTAQELNHASLSDVIAKPLAALLMAGSEEIVEMRGERDAHNGTK
jgi:hypothetical protein